MRCWRDKRNHDKRTRGYRWKNKQTNKHVEIKWLKYVRGLIADANCFRVGGERGCGGELCTWGRERGTWEYPPCAFGLRLTSELSPLSGEGQHQVQLFTSAACENTLNTMDYSRRHCSTAKPHTHTISNHNADVTVWNKCPTTKMSFALDTWWTNLLNKLTSLLNFGDILPTQASEMSPKSNLNLLHRPGQSLPVRSGPQICRCNAYASLCTCMCN